jgi:hypothetical protein
MFGPEALRRAGAVSPTSPYQIPIRRDLRLYTGYNRNVHGGEVFEVRFRIGGSQGVVKAAPVPALAAFEAGRCAPSRECPCGAID